MQNVKSALLNEDGLKARLGVKSYFMILGPEEVVNGLKKLSESKGVGLLPAEQIQNGFMNILGKSRNSFYQRKIEIRRKQKFTPFPSNNV